MAVTDAEIGKIQDFKFGGKGIGAPVDERREVESTYFNTFVDTGLAQRIANNLPQGVEASMSMMTEVEKALTGRKREIGRQIRETANSSMASSGTIYPGLRPKSFLMQGSVLRLQSHHNVAISAVMQQFTNRAVEHTRLIDPKENMLLNQTGFRLQRVGQSAHQPLSQDDETEKRYIERFLKYGGDAPPFNPGKASMLELGREPLDSLMSKLIRDRFEIAAIAIEPQMTKSGNRLSGIFAVDADTIWDVQRYGEPEGEYYDQQCVHAQIVDQQMRLLTTGQIFVKRFNTRSDMRTRGYGMSEVQTCALMTKMLLNVLTATDAQFDRSSMPQGILLLSGSITDESLGHLQNHWESWMNDPGGGLGLPVLSMRDPNAKASVISMDKKPTEIQGSNILSLILAVASAVFGEDVIALNGSAFGGQNGGLNSGKDTIARQDKANKVGFTPALRAIFEVLNEVHYPLLQDKWRIVPVGLEAVDNEWWLNAFQANTIVDEMRAVFGLKPLGGVIGNSLSHNPAIAQMSISGLTSGVELGGEMGKVTKPVIQTAESVPLRERSKKSKPQARVIK